MRCPNCSARISVNREYCPSCGHRIQLSFDAVAQAAKTEEARARGQRIESYVRIAIVLLILLAAGIYGYNDLFDKKLTFDGAMLPTIDAPQAITEKTDTVLPPYRELLPVEAPQPGHPRGFAYRRSPIKDQLRTLNGSTPEVEKAIQKGLRFLAGIQDRNNGTWAITAKRLRINPERDETTVFSWGGPGLTALALLPFLAEGEVFWVNDKKLRGRYYLTVQRALKYLVQSQDTLSGRIGPTNGNFMYNHGIATLALAEAAGMSGDPYLVEAAQKAVDFIQRIQGYRGGWGYRDKINARQDTSVTSWQVQALVAAKEAGLSVDDKVIQRALQYYQAATDPVSGRVAYDFEDSVLRPNLYGVALMCRLRLGEESTASGVRLLARKAASLPPKINPKWGPLWRFRKDETKDATLRARAFDPYRWYFTTYGLYFKGGEEWEAWHPQIVAALLKLQDTDNAWRGNDVWSVKAGAAYSTALCLLTLQVYYRYY